MPTLIEALQENRAVLCIGRMAGDPGAQLAVMHQLARLPFRKVVVLDGPPGLAAAWRQEGRLVDELDLLVGQEPRIDESRVAWLALPRTQRPQAIWLESVLRRWFATQTVLIVGCDLRDARFTRYFQQATAAVGPQRPQAVALLAQPLDIGDRLSWEKDNVSLVVSDPAAWIQALCAQFEATAAQRDNGQAPTIPDGKPYQFLDYYTEADRDRFFGRENAINDLGDLVLANQLVVCFGPSGAGKSSLLQAGLMPRLRSHGCLPLYSRPATDPVAAIEQVVRRQYPAAISGAAGLAAVLAGLARDQQRTVVVILDQAEEMFTLLGEQTARQLAGQVAAALQQAGAAVHVVMALREDYLTHLHTMQPQLPGLFDHRFRLRPLARIEAQQAIVAPAGLVGLQYEPALVETLLADLSRTNDHIEPADLQIVCDTLYRDLVSRGETTFRLAHYQALGGSDALLARYLEDVVAADPAPDQVRGVLKALVTAEGTKAVLETGEIARLAGLAPEAAAAVVERLERPHRLVRLVAQDGQMRCELAHEVLAPRILAWIQDPAERDAKVMHDLLRAELHNWRQFQVLPGAGKLRAVDSQRDNPYLRLSRDEVELMVRGAVEYDAAPDVWLARAEKAGVAAGGFLLPALDSPQAEVRRRAASLLGPGVAVAELDQRLRRPDPAVRVRAAVTLGELAVPTAWRRLRGARFDRDDGVRATVWEGLETIDPRRARQLRRQDEVMPLLAAGSLVYWLGLLIAGARGGLSPGPSIAALAAGLWLAALGVLGWLLPWLATGLAGETVAIDEGEQTAPPGRRLGRWLVGGGLLLAVAWPLVSTWGWRRGGLAWLLVAIGAWGKATLAATVFLAYLALLVLLPATTTSFLLATAGTLLILAALALAVARWHGDTLDRSAALVVLAAAAGTSAASLVAGLERGNLAGALVVAGFLAAGRWIARRPLVYGGGSQNMAVVVIDVYIRGWDLLDQISFAVKPLVGGGAGALWAGLLVGAAADLSPGSAPVWNGWAGLGLGIGVGLGVWLADSSRWRALVLPAAGGAIVGALTLGLPGVLVGAGMGAGVGVGEWLAARRFAGPNNQALAAEQPLAAAEKEDA